jgi:hypothetical protein
MVEDGREGLREGYAAHVEEDFYSVDEAARILKLTPGEGKLACNRLVSDWFSCIFSAGVARAGAPPLDPAPAPPVVLARARLGWLW